MKTLKETQKNKLVLAILIVLILGIVIVGRISNGKVMADTSGDGAECTHTYGDYIPKDVTSHSRTCSLCNNEDVQEHNFVAFRHDETLEHSRGCIVCGYAETGLEHSYDENGLCSCGAIDPETVGGGPIDPETCNHIYGGYLLKDATTHSRACGLCNTKEIEEHHFVEFEAEGTGAHSRGCDKCGYAETDLEHRYGAYTSKDATNHSRVCEGCEHEEVAAHTFEDYKDLGDGTHSRECTVCKYEEVPAEHSYGTDGKCVCGAEKQIENCEHEEYVAKYDETNHWEECKDCKEIKENTKEAHKYEKYTDNKNGTHTAKCTKCDYELTQKHDPNEDCEKCGYKVDNKDNTTGDKNEVDNTVVDKDIPHTGVKDVAFIFIFVVGAIGVIAAIKMRKYKGL